MADDEGDDEVYVVVELTGVIDSQVMDLAGKQCTVLGVDTPEPVLKLGSYLFTGEYKDTIGTCVLFEEIETATGEDTNRTAEASGSGCRPKRQKPQKELRYFGKTEKRLDMKTSFLQEKAAVRAAELMREAEKPDQEDSKPDQEDSPTKMAVDDS
ncbi:general transcription factor 3C polypeptide 6-like [Dermacentor variabilis]|uniref:general transcription factor 3C polypeptide 6-like n=1 Tax=Dermacentor variabilis TaxID=34621 RepID=UPI003F5B3561